jgi:hypothetical protein
MQKWNARKDSEFEIFPQNEGKEIREEGIFRELGGLFSCARRMLVFVMQNPPRTLRNFRELHYAREGRARTLTASFWSVIRAKIVSFHRKAFECGLFSDFLALLTSKNGSVIESKGFQSINNCEIWE